MSRSTFLGFLAACAAALIGSGWQITSRHGVTTTLGPVELAVLRYGVPALVLLPVLLRSTGLFPAGLPKRHLAMLVVGGGLPFGLMVMAGAQWAPAAHIGVFVSGSLPLFTALGARWVDGTPITGLRLAGLVLVAVGLAGFGFIDPAGLALNWRGDLCFLLAAMLWAVYTLVSRRAGLTAWQGTALVNAWSALLLLPLVLVVGAPRLLTAPWSDVAWQALGQGVMAGLLGLFTYLVAVAHLGAARASLSAALVPLLTACGAALLLGEPLQPQTAAAAALVAFGVLCAAFSSQTGR
ncbi:MAG: DMT family transporter [Ramlibacter sp.]